MQLRPLIHYDKLRLLHKRMVVVCIRNNDDIVGART